MVGLAEEPLVQEDTKINMESARFDKDKDEVRVDVGQKLIGLTKEELENYRNDPFWKNIRMFLFVLFWLLWAAMFVGAVLIVVLSPKCAEKQQSKWWQSKVSYQLLVPTFFDHDGSDGVGTIAGVTEKIDLLRKIGVTTIYPSPVLHSQKENYFDVQGVIDHNNVDIRFGTNDDLKQLVEAAHDRDMYVVLDVPLSSVSKDHPWMQSPNADTDKAFIWKTFAEGAPIPEGYYRAPARGGKAYLGYPDAEHPVLDWSNELVKNTILGAIHKLLDIGVDGFNLDHVARLAVDESGKPKHAEAIQRLKDLTGEIRMYIKSRPELENKDIVLFSSLHDIHDDLRASVTEANDLHYTIDSSFANLNATSCPKVSKCVHDTLSSALSTYKTSGFTPLWQFSNAANSRLASRFDADTANLMTFMQLTLPGAMSLYYGQELGLKDGIGGDGAPQQGIMQWTTKGDDHHGFIGGTDKVGKLFFAETEGGDAATDNFESQYAMENSPLKVYQKLAKLRQRDEVMIVGETIRDELVGDVVIFSRFIRTAEGSTEAAGSAYVVVLNFGATDAEVDLTKLTSGVLPDKKSLTAAEVSAVTPGVQDLRARERIDLSATPLKVPALQGILLRI